MYFFELLGKQEINSSKVHPPSYVQYLKNKVTF